MKKSFYSLSLICFTLLSFYSCSSDKAWEEAKSQNSSSSVEQFIVENPQSKHIDSAKVLFEELKWYEVKASESYFEYKEYISNYPESKYSAEAFSMLEEILWNEAKKSYYPNTKFYSEYVNNFPNGKYIEQAKSNLEQIKIGLEDSKISQEDAKWNQIRKQDKNGDKAYLYVLYLDQNPNGKYREEAKRLLGINAEKHDLKVYTLARCSRCQFVIDYFNQNKIPFIELKTEEISNEKQMRRAIIESNKSTSETINMPVIDHTGEIFFNIPDIENFTINLANKISSNKNKKDNEVKKNKEFKYISCQGGNGLYILKYSDNETIKITANFGEYSSTEIAKVVGSKIIVESSGDDFRYILSGDTLKVRNEIFLYDNYCIEY